MTTAQIMPSNYRFLCFLFPFVLALSNCDFRTPPNCLVLFQDQPAQLSGFSVSEEGLASKPGSPLHWSRCPAGMQYTNPNTCSGIPLFLSFDQAISYAQDISEKSGQRIRLPLIDELEDITENSCINPSLNTNVFPAASTDNFWTSEQHSFRDNLACAFYTYQGLASCLEVKSTEHPFMLVIERDSF